VALARVPAGARACFLVALVNALAWALITPAFQVPDEATHVGYAQYVAENGRLPPGDDGPALSSELTGTMALVQFGAIAGNPDARSPASPATQRALRAFAATRPPRGNGSGRTSATAQTPLFYVVAAAAYRLSPSSGLLDRLLAMRILACLMAALSAALIFLFVRELLPGVPWAWTAGGLVAALHPLFAFVSSGVNPDAGLILASSALLLALARSFRRGLTVRRGLAIGLALGLGIAFKATMLAFVPGVALGVAVLAARARRAGGLRGAGAALGAAACCVLAVVAAEMTRRQGADAAGVAGTTLERWAGFRGFASYAWQLYLPRLPFMQDFFPADPLGHLWVDGWVGIFGWLDTAFPAWVYTVGGWAYALVGALALAAVVARRGALRARGLELLTYLALLAGLLLIIAWFGYDARINGPGPFEQPRYLLPLLGLGAAIAALAARAGGRRWGPTLAILLVGLALAQDLGAQILVLSRYYG
jgi:4-amino-4-deoxy-L-arabinose transferase-like glycosyltransferase